MKTNPLDDTVSQQYERWIYPEPITDLPSWLSNNWQWFDPSHAHRLFWPDRDYQPDLEILIAGCGTNQAAVFAYNNPGAHVTAIDISSSSLKHHQFLKEKYGLKNLDLHRLPIEEIRTLGNDYDLIVSTGVLHHLADPNTGLQALAQCLRAGGVAAIMLYARYGRIGVEMLQGIFRDLNLQQDESSLEIARSAIALLPDDHPIRSYINIAPDLRYDAGLVDTFLHGRDRSYTVQDCLDLVASAGLEFQDWFMKTPYEPPTDKGNPLLAAIASLSKEKQWAAMERINHRNACHFFMACKPERPPESYKPGDSEKQLLDSIPFYRYRCGTKDSKIFRPGLSLNLDQQQQALLRQIDGKLTIREIIELIQPQPAEPASSNQSAIFLIKQLIQLANKDFIGLGLQPA